MNKMAASMVVFVFGYVFVMRILYKLSRLLADWLADNLTGAQKREKEIKHTVIQLKSDQLKISAQDEFAKYMRLDRKINKLNDEHSELVKQRSGTLSRRKRILTVICIGLLLRDTCVACNPRIALVGFMWDIVICHITFLFTYRKEPVAVLPTEWFYPLNSVLAFPTGVAGAIGLPCWIITSNNIISRTLF